jgi:hypothetical protein
MRHRVTKYEEYQIMVHYDSVLQQLEWRCRALDKWMSSGDQKTTKEFNLEISDDRFKAFYHAWRSLQYEPKQWLDEQVKRIKGKTPCQNK